MTREELRKLLRKVRVDRGLTQVKLAERLERSQGWITDIENGRVQVTMEDADAWLRQCGRMLRVEVAPLGSSEQGQREALVPLLGLEPEDLQRVLRFAALLNDNSRRSADAFLLMLETSGAVVKRAQ